MAKPSAVKGSSNMHRLERRSLQVPSRPVPTTAASRPAPTTAAIFIELIPLPSLKIRDLFELRSFVMYFYRKICLNILMAKTTHTSIILLTIVFKIVVVLSIMLQLFSLFD
ncbi:hypothetical protein P8452_44100 [Trifolium repens]|nr:hypothetical protein P8452_44100 [Trifolium repens]